MSTLESLLDSILADELAAARAAERAIGYVGCDIPIDLLLASGRYACHLPWLADRRTPFSDRWLETSFMPWARSMLEDWAAGRFDFFECVIFFRGDDSAQRLYYYVCELQRRGHLAGPQALIFDVAKIHRESSIQRTIAAVQRLAERLEISERQMRDGIEAADRQRDLLTGLDNHRGAPGSLYERIGRASLFADLDNALSESAFAPRAESKRVLLAGAAPPDDRLHLAVEATGWVVTGESHERSLQRLGPKIGNQHDDAATAIGHQTHALALGSRSFVDRASLLNEAVIRADADAVLLWLIEEDEALTWSVPAERAALDAVEMPVLVATRRRWDASDGIAEEFSGFLEGLGV